jgi:lysophospholipase L1-like esterase
MNTKTSNKKNTIWFFKLLGIVVTLPFVIAYIIIYSQYGQLFSKEIVQTHSILLTYSPQNNQIENSISIIWGQPSTPNVNYILMRDGEYFTKFNYGNNSYIDTNLIPNANYTYQIYVENSSNTILEKSNILNLTTQNSLTNPLVITSHSVYKTYSAFGDSITQGYEAPISYFDRISQYLKNTEGTISYNEGIGGNTTYDLLNRINGEIQQENPDLVTLMIGANDIRMGTVNNPTITSLDYKNNLLKILSDIDPSPQRTVFIFELSNITDWNTPGFTAGSNARLQEFNKIIQGVANSMGIPYISLPKFSQIPGSLTSEGLHPSDIGDNYIYEQLKSELLQYN